MSIAEAGSIRLIEMTGGTERLKQGLELVGKEPEPAGAATPETSPE
jgi:hypothetical protein